MEAECPTRPGPLDQSPCPVPTKCNFKGQNASAWMQDVPAVNEFNEDMHYGDLDREFGRIQPL